MGDESNVWQKHAEKLRRQEQLRRIDAWLSALHEQRPFLFNALVAAISTVIGGILFGILYLLDRFVPQ